MQRFAPVAAMLAAFFFVMAASCAPKLVPERERPRPVYLSAAPEELLSALRERNNAIRGLRAGGHLDYRFTYAGRGYRGTSVKFQFLKPDKVYIRGYARLAGTLFILVSDGASFWAEDTKHKKVYSGPVRRTVRTDGEAKIWEGVHPVVLAEALLLDDLDPAQVVCETYPDHYIILLLDKAGAGGLVPRRKLWVDRTNLRVVRHQVFTESGRLRTDVILADYREVGAIELPHLFIISRPWEELKLKLELRDVKLDPEFNDDLFRYEVLEGFELRGLESEETDHAESG